MKDHNGMVGSQGYSKFSERFVGLLMFILVLLVSPSIVFAAEAVTNGNLNTSASWTLSTATYDGANTNTADGSGSGTVLSSGRNTQTIGTMTQTVSIPAGSSIANATDVVTSVMHSSTAVASVSRAITIQLQYFDTSTVEIFSNATFADGIAWTAVANQTATSFPLTFAQEVTAIIVTLDTKNGNNASA
ncbi:MAG: hypothetical protein C0615_02305, partial [Desulfuromonas sp.]